MKKKRNNITEGYLVYRKTFGEEKQQFCSSYKQALELSDRMGGGYITVYGNRSPAYFRQQNKAILDSLIKDEEKEEAK